jgi:L-threonylcarbamoyladenylate synthase
VLVASPEAIATAGRLLRQGGLVAFPTETVYGLGANALDAAAVEGIYRAKRRSADDPCIVHILDTGGLSEVADVHDRVMAALLERLARALWPGPLTVVLPKSERIPPVVTAGRPTVAVRVPAHSVAREILAAAGVPVAAPSANRFMHTSPTTAQHVWDDLAGEIDLIVDGGPAEVGIESTILDLTETPPVLLRPGGVGLERLREIVGEVRVAARGACGEELEAAGPRKAPGLFERHYAPAAETVVYEGPPERVRAALRRDAGARRAQGQIVGILATEEDVPLLNVDEGVYVRSAGRTGDSAGMARRLFAALRELEACGVTAILAHAPDDESGLGRGIRDRLVRAAAGHVQKV